MNLTIDQGNSSTKIGIFDRINLTASYNIEFDDQKTLKEIIDRHKPENSILSSVGNSSGELIDFLKKKMHSFIFLNHETPLPFSNLYETPETLGKDRIAALAGAQALYPGETVLVIDAGTALTLDLLVNNTYLGGNISPGMLMRFRALHQQTSQLPMVSPQDSPFWGTSTLKAIAAGVQNGIVLETQAYCERVTNDYPGAKIIITGGDADFFARNLKSIIFVHSNLVLYGLNHLIEYNV